MEGETLLFLGGTADERQQSRSTESYLPLRREPSGLFNLLSMWWGRGGGGNGGDGEWWWWQTMEGVGGSGGDGSLLFVEIRDVTLLSLLDDDLRTQNAGREGGVNFDRE